MPCTCDGYPEPEPDLHNGPLAEMLCATMQEHEARGEMSCFSKDQLAWWEEHKKRDKARLEQDLAEAKLKRDRSRLLRKLTPYEKQILGINEDD